MGDDSEDVVPCTNVLSTLCNRSTEYSSELVGVQPNLNPVVKEGKQWSKRKGNNKDGDKAVLDDCRRERERERETERFKLHVNHPTCTYAIATI